MSNRKAYWFPAKRYGWGWGLPNIWQGWVVYGVFALLSLVDAVWVLPSQGQGTFAAYLAILVVVLIAICLAKGEPPGWHWGGK